MLSSFKRYNNPTKGALRNDSHVYIKITAFNSRMWLYCSTGPLYSYFKLIYVFINGVSSRYFLDTYPTTLEGILKIAKQESYKTTK